MEFKKTHIIKQKINVMAVYAIFAVLCIVALFPALFMLLTSFFSPDEIVRSYGGRPMFFHLIPYELSLDGYFRVFIASPNYLMKFWNSLLITGAIVAGQVMISCLSGYGFSLFRFPLKNFFFFIIVVIMMLPPQVLLVPQYMVLDYLGLIGSYAALIIPGAFAAFGIFLITQVFTAFPKETIEAAKVDGAGHLTILFKIVIPNCKGGIASLAILCFIDNWNMVEQPLFFLRDFRQYPMSVFLSLINTENLGVAFACAVLAMTPVLLLYLYFNDELVHGIEKVYMPG